MLRGIIKAIDKLHAFFFWKCFFSTQCFLTFQWVGLQMLLRCCLIPISIIALMRFLYLDLKLFMLCLCDLLFILIIIFIMIESYNLMNTNTFSFFQNMSYYFWMIMWMKNVNDRMWRRMWISSTLIFPWFLANFSLVLVIKFLLIKKRVLLKNKNNLRLHFFL